MKTRKEWIDICKRTHPAIAHKWSILSNRSMHSEHLTMADALVSSFMFLSDTTTDWYSIYYDMVDNPLKYERGGGGGCLMKYDGVRFYLKTKPDVFLIARRRMPLNDVYNVFVIVSDKERLYIVTITEHIDNHIANGRWVVIDDKKRKLFREA